MLATAPLTLSKLATVTDLSPKTRSMLGELDAPPTALSLV